MSWSGCWPVVVLSESSAGAAASAGAPAAWPAGPGEAELPAGTVTFLLTDIEGSTQLWEAVPEAMEVALERHNRLLTGVIEDHGGVVVTSRGGVNRVSAISDTTKAPSRHPPNHPTAAATGTTARDQGNPAATAANTASTL